MRELKFRAWSEETKSFEYFDLYEGTECGLTNLQIWARNSPIEQYTGLKDKNGKEIYEGDIVRIDSMDELRIGYVDLVNDQYCIVCGVDEDGYKIVAEFYYYSKPEENCEVIGNIHENADLLKEEE